MRRSKKSTGRPFLNLNVLALMATKNGDSVAADAAFKRIGDNSDIEIRGSPKTSSIK